MSLLEACGVPEPQVVTTHVESEKKIYYEPVRGVLPRCGECGHGELYDSQHHSDGVHHISIYTCKKCSSVTKYDWQKRETTVIVSKKK